MPKKDYMEPIESLDVQVGEHFLEFVGDRHDIHVYLRKDVHPDKMWCICRDVNDALRYIGFRVE